VRDLYATFCSLTEWCDPEIVSLGGIFMLVSSGIILAGFVFGFLWGFFDNTLDDEE
jgi:hypothetical protein